MKKTLYNVLGVESSATEAEIAEGYARCQAAMELGAYDRNAQIIAKEAYAVLSNPTKRAMYDMSLAPAPIAVSEVHTEAALETTRTGLDWRQGIAIAVGVGAISGWWFSRPKAPPAAPSAPVVAVAAPVAGAAPELEPVAIVAPVAPVAASGAELSGEDLFAKLAPSIVRINVSSPSGQQTGIGSGVVIAQGSVITNCHVAEAGSVLQVKSGDTSHDARLALADQAHDLCKLDVPSLKAEPVTVRLSNVLRTGQKVVAIGAPKGLDLTISEGIVSSLRKVDDGTLIQTTAPVSPGSSGGGLFDMQGNLVGIVTFQVSTGQNLNFAAPAEWIDKMRATQGNGIITKLTGPRIEQREDSADKESALTGELPGRWACRDTIKSTVFEADFEPNGNMEMRRDNKSLQGRWRLSGQRIEIQPFNSSMIQVEYLNADKLILYFGKGFRSVCTRR